MRSSLNFGPHDTQRCQRWCPAERRKATMAKVKLTREMVERIEKALDERKLAAASATPDGGGRRRSRRGGRRASDEAGAASTVESATPGS
jgi:hypothetical protein